MFHLLQFCIALYGGYILPTTILRAPETSIDNELRWENLKDLQIS